jgi:hypothetical protein
MSTNHILVDFENVQPADIAALEHENIKVTIFVGANQQKIPTEIVLALQRIGCKGKYIQIAGNGPHALDLHIAYYIGEIAALEPTTFFHIISKDKGFGPLIEHLQTRGISVFRIECINDIQFLKALNCKSPDERIKHIVEKLTRQKVSRPGTVKTLNSTIAALFHKELQAEEITALINGMAEKHYITITEKKVTYMLPEKP